jgi:hypothetical protein
MNKSGFELGDRVSDEVELQRMPPPVVLAVQPDSFVKLESPEALRSWEKAVRQTTGLEMGGDKFAGSASESCSAGCSDDCDVC